ncbi:hypothetical protein C8R48DRAFT_781481 [Suillus tomentosus]|nr:hypothetical protein C8R48DRAFT_781481 [Suillus tomentosus]
MLKPILDCTSQGSYRRPTVASAVEYSANERGTPVASFGGSKITGFREVVGRSAYSSSPPEPPAQSGHAGFVQHALPASKIFKRWYRYFHAYLSFPAVHGVQPFITLKVVVVRARHNQSGALFDSLVNYEITRDADAGHAQLASYMKSQNVCHLNDAMKHFQLVLNQCPVGHPDHATAPTNLAWVHLKGHIRNDLQDIDVSTSLFCDGAQKYHETILQFSCGRCGTRSCCPSSTSRAFTYIPLHAAHLFRTGPDGSREKCLEDLYCKPTLSGSGQIQTDDEKVCLSILGRNNSLKEPRCEKNSAISSNLSLKRSERAR